MQFLLDNRFGLLSLLILFGAFNGYLLAFMFLFIKKGRELANRIFAVIIVIIALRLTEMCLVVYGLIWKYPSFAGITFPLLFLLGPLYFLYTKRLLNPAFRISWRFAWMAIPALIQYYRVWSWLTMDLSRKSQYLKSSPIWEMPDVPLHVYIMLGLTLAHTSLYLFFSYRELWKQQTALKNQVSDNQLLIRFTWLRKLTFGAFAFTGSYLVIFILLVIFEQYGTLIDRAWLLMLSLVVHAAGYFAIQQPEYFANDKEKPDVDENSSSSEGEVSRIPKYSKSSLSAEQAQTYLKLLKEYMQEKPYLREDLKASDLAIALKIPTYHLSQTLTQECDTNFFDFINKYRVEEAQRLLQNPSYRHLTILAIAHEAGFNNKASFNRAFKKFSGQTPSAFMQSGLRVS